MSVAKPLAEAGDGGRRGGGGIEGRRRGTEGGGDAVRPDELHVGGI